MQPNPPPSPAAVASSASRFAAPSPLVQLHLPDGRMLEGPRGATAGALLRPIVAELPAPLVAVVINEELHELTWPVAMEARARPVTMADVDGARIYRRSLTFLLEAAFAEFWRRGGCWHFSNGFCRSRPTGCPTTRSCANSSAIRS